MGNTLKAMHKIKIIAPKYIVAPLQLLGLETYPADSEAEAAQALNKAVKKKEPALIFLSERLAVDLKEEVARLNRKPELNIVMIPDNRGNIGLASSRIKELVKNSIGADIIIGK